MYFFIDKHVLCCYHASGGTSGVVCKESYLVQSTLARKLRVLRAERGLTLREAEQLTSVDKDTLSKIERGLRHPYDVTLSKLARGYGVPVEDLLEEPVLAGKDEAPTTGRSEPGLDHMRRQHDSIPVSD